MPASNAQMHVSLALYCRPAVAPHMTVLHMFNLASNFAKVTQWAQQSAHIEAGNSTASAKQ
jgi:hypothetical protein